MILRTTIKSLITFPKQAWLSTNIMFAQWVVWCNALLQWELFEVGLQEFLKLVFFITGPFIHPVTRICSCFVVLLSVIYPASKGQKRTLLRKSFTSRPLSFSVQFICPLRRYATLTSLLLIPPVPMKVPTMHKCCQIGIDRGPRSHRWSRWRCFSIHETQGITPSRLSTKNLFAKKVKTPSY